MPLINHTLPHCMYGTYVNITLNETEKDGKIMKTMKDIWIWQINETRKREVDMDNERERWDLKKILL